MKLRDLDQQVKPESQANASGEIARQHRQSDRKAANPDRTAAADRVDLSPHSRLLQRVNESVKAQDPGRAERLRLLTQQVRSGAYEADPAKIARSMLTDLVKDLG